MQALKSFNSVEAVGDILDNVVEVHPVLGAHTAQLSIVICSFWAVP